MEPLSKDKELAEDWRELAEAFLKLQDVAQRMVPLVVDHAEDLKKRLAHKSASWSALKHKGKNQRHELDRQQRRLQKQKRKIEELTLENQGLKQLITIRAMDSMGYKVAEAFSPDSGRSPEGIDD